MLVAVLAGAVACGGDEPTAPKKPTDRPLKVSLTVEPPSILPGEASVVTARAEVPDTVTITRFELAISGFGSDTVVNLPILGPGTHEYFADIDVPNGPIEGEVVFRARARVGTVTDSAQGTLVIRDDGAPRVALTAPRIVEPPDTLAVTVEAEDAAFITQLVIHLEGAVRRDTILSSPGTRDLYWTLTELVPSTARLGDSVLVQASARDGFGKLTSATRVIRFADTTPPTIAVRVDPVHHAGVDESYFPLTFFPGDVVHIRLQAADNRSLTWIGYRMLQFADSARATSDSQSAEFAVTIPAGTNTAHAEIQAFARDSSGNGGLQWAYPVVMDGTFRPIQALTPYANPLIEYDQQGGYVLDAKRDVLYFTTFRNAVHVVGLSPLAAQPDIPFGGSVRSVDLTPSGDSLVALVVGRPNLLVRWDLARGPSSADIIPVTALGNCDGWDMQVAANGRAFVTGSGCPTVEVDLRTGAQRTRAIPPALRNLVASGDHGLIVAWNQDEAQSYRSDTDALTPVRSLFASLGTVELEHAGPALDHAGNAVLIRNRLYNSDLTSYGWIQPDPRFFPPAPALSADGHTAFPGIWPGYWRIDAATGTPTERIILPRFPWRIIAHPDGQRLIVFGWQWLGVVDLR